MKNKTIQKSFHNVQFSQDQQQTPSIPEDQTQSNSTPRPIVCAISFKVRQPIPKYLQPKYYFRFPMDLILSTNPSDIAKKQWLIPFNTFKEIQALKLENRSPDNNLLHVYFSSIDPHFYSSSALLLDQLISAKRQDTVKLISSLEAFLNFQQKFQKEFAAKGNRIQELQYQNIYKTQEEYDSFNSSFFQENQDSFIFSLQFKADLFSNFYLYMEKAVFNSVAQKILSPNMSLRDQFQNNGVFEFLFLDQATLFENLTQYTIFLTNCLVNLSQNATKEQQDDLLFEILTLDKLKIKCQIKFYTNFFVKTNEFIFSVLFKLNFSDTQKEQMQRMRDNSNIQNIQQNQQNNDSTNSALKNKENLKFIKTYYPEYLELNQKSNF